MYRCKAPKSSEEFTAYYQLRWQILRQPWQQPLGSEQDNLEQQAHHRMIVDEQDNVVAVGRLHRSAQYIGHIRYMAVTPEVKGQGLGRQLLAELEKLAAELGVQELQLNARESAITFYEKLGYQHLGFSHLLFDEIKHDKMSKMLTCAVHHQQKQAKNLQATWHQTIPLSKAMNVAIGYYDHQKIVTSCDLIFNKNLHNTMFAGSIYTLATLTGWGWVYLLLDENSLQADIVLAKGSIKYLAPLAGVASARTSVDLVDGQCDALRLGKNARFSITVEVFCGDNIVAIFTGNYAAVAKI